MPVNVLIESIFFLHIQKTAGSTFRNLLLKLFGSEVNCGLRGPDSSLSYEKKIRIEKLIKSNFPVIVHGHPDRFHDVWEFVLDHKKPYSILTFMRDPVARVLSNFCWGQWVEMSPSMKRLYCKSIILNGQNYRKPSQPFTLDEHKFISFMQNNHLAENYQTKVLSALGRRKEYKKKCTNDDLSMAKENINQGCRIVGISEKYQQSLELFFNLYDIDIPKQSCENLKVSPINPGINNLSEAMLQIILDYNQKDVELYQYACSMFEQQCVEMRAQKNITSLHNNSELHKRQ